jgi:hypothetical protein
MLAGAWLWHSVHIGRAPCEEASPTTEARALFPLSRGKRRVADILREPTSPNHTPARFGYSSHTRPASNRPAFFLRFPPHCLKKNATR